MDDILYCKIASTESAVYGSNAYDVIKFVEEVSWESNDLDAPKSGRDLSGEMHRGRVGEKRKINIKLVPLAFNDLKAILQLVRREYVWVRTNIFPEGEVVFQGYNSTRKGGVMVMTTDGVIRHSGVSFNIIER